MGKVVRTETTVRELDADGVVLRETTTTVVVSQSPTEAPEMVGVYL